MALTIMEYFGGVSPKVFGLILFFLFQGEAQNDRIVLVMEENITITHIFVSYS